MTKAMQKENVIGKIVVWTIAGMTVGAFLAIFASGIGSSEKSECLKWQNEAKDIKGFYLTEWQKSQCDAHGVSVAAPVR